MSSSVIVFLTVIVCSTLSFATGVVKQLPGSLTDIKLPVAQVTPVINKADAKARPYTLTAACSNGVNVRIVNLKAYVNGATFGYNLKFTASPNVYIINLYDAGKIVYRDMVCKA